jgi:F-type H+/Na+-transporting ATPase subunit alpha
MTTFESTIALLAKHLDTAPQVVELISAAAISKEFVDILHTQFGNSIIIKQTIDTKVVDGVMIKIGDMVFDSSVQNQLAQLDTEMSSADAKDFLNNLKSKIAGFTPVAEFIEVGTVLTIKDGVAQVSGLSGVQYFEQVKFDNGVIGIAFNLTEASVGVVLLGATETIKAGDRAERTNKLASIPVSEEILGRIIDPTGTALDGKPAYKSKALQPIEKVAPGVMMRKPVETPLQTGIKAIDALIPIGRGQRELILGDRQTGKTSVAIDTIINQKGQDVICIYVAIGQKASKIARIKGQLETAGALAYTVIVSATASEPAGMLFLAPYSGVAIAEYFAKLGKAVLIVYDDLTKHAVAYRELSLLLKRPPGREAYPGDVFYLHSRLLERACNLNDENGGGSITALPIVETQAGDIGAYIPTNVISITDGQIFLESELFYKGQRPAIGIGLSVSRVGGAAQTKAIKKVSGSMKLALAQYREIESFAQFASDLDPQTKAQIERGRRTLEVLKQTNNMPLSVAAQVVSIYAVNNGMFDTVEISDITNAQDKAVEYVQSRSDTLWDSLNNGKWSEEIETELKTLISEAVLLLPSHGV